MKELSKKILKLFEQSTGLEQEKNKQSEHGSLKNSKYNLK